MRVIGIAIVMSFFVLALVPLPAGDAGGQYCVTQGQLSEPSDQCCSSSGTLPITAPDGTTFYIDSRTDTKAGVAWIYEETNHVASLQRGGIDPVGSHQVNAPSAASQKKSEDKLGTPVTITQGGIPIAGSSDTVVGVSTLTPTASASTGSGYVPLVQANSTTVRVSAWQTPGVHLSAAGRYDGCYDTLFDPVPDTNLI